MIIRQRRSDWEPCITCMARQEILRKFFVGTITRIQHFENIEADIVVNKI
jgi:hypothetical protein